MFQMLLWRYVQEINNYGKGNKYLCRVWVGFMMHLNKTGLKG